MRENSPARRQRSHESGEEVFDHLAVNVGEAEVTALKAVGELLVVEAQQMEDGGLQIVDVDFVAGDGKAELVGFAVNQAVLHAAASEKDGEAIGIMVAAKNFAGGSAAFAEGCASKFAAPHDKGVIE